MALIGKILAGLVFFTVVEALAHARISGKEIGNAAHILVWLFFVGSAITTFEKRVVQMLKASSDAAKKYRSAVWTIIFHFMQYGSLVALAVMNWRIAIACVVIGFVFAVTPISETLGRAFYDMVVNPLRRK